MARRIKERKLKSRNITIIGEGLTERGYFKHLKSLKGYRYTCKPRNFSQQSIDDLQKQIGKVLEDDGVAVCVFDADVARDKPAERSWKLCKRNMQEKSRSFFVTVCRLSSFGF